MTHLDDFGVNVAFLLGAVEDGLLYGPSRHQHQNQHRLLLPYAVCAVTRLQHTPRDSWCLRRATDFIIFENMIWWRKAQKREGWKAVIETLLRCT